MTEDKFNLRPLWNVLIEIYQEIDKVCQRHGLRVYGTSGTALGAVRHHGFIPWDDDLDVGMPRPDYDKFMEIADAELPSWLHTLTWKNCKDYGYLFGKVIITDPAKVEAVCTATGNSAPMGIFVDVFPFDGYPTSKIGRWLRILKRGIYKSQGYALSSTIASAPNVQAKIGCALFKLLGLLGGPKTYRDTLALHEKEMRRIPFETAGRVMNNMWFKEETRFAKSPKSEWYSAKEFGNGKVLPFEHATMRVFDNVDVYLRSVFHDYMKLPPEEKRHPAHNDDSDGYEEPWRIGLPEWRNT